MLDIERMTMTDDKIVFHVHADFKQSRLGNESMEIILPAFKDDKRICIVHTLHIYLNKTSKLRKSSKLFISTVRPHNEVSKDTIARWIKASLKLAGVDVSIFKPHSARAAATSAAQRKGVPLGEILSVARWSNEATFAKFYRKPLHASSDDNFAQAILSR